MVKVFNEAVESAVKYKESGSDDFMAEVMSLLDEVGLRYVFHVSNMLLISSSDIS